MKEITIVLVIIAVFADAASAGALKRSKRSIPSPHEIQIQTIGNTIKLDWSFSDTRSDVTFLIKYRKKNDRDWITVRTPQRSLQLSHLEYSTSYEIQILAQTPSGVSLPSTIIQVPISDPPRPATPRRQESASIRTPGSFEAALNGQDTIHLSWQPVMCGSSSCMYEVTVKQEGTNSEQVFQYSSTKAVIGKMTPGQRFVFQVRAVQNDRTMSYPQTVRATIPSARTPVVIADNIQVQPVQNQPTSVKVIWSVDSRYRSNVAGYQVFYSKNKDAQSWSTVRVTGQNPEAVLSNIEPGTPYFIRVVTEFRNGDTKTTSQTYRFVTPNAPLIENIKLIYNSDQTMRLEWILHGHVNSADIEGARVLWTTDRSLPENRWQVLEARRGENGMTLPQKLEGNKQYYFKIQPRVRGRGLVDSSTVFEIMTRPHTGGSSSANLRLPDNYYDLRFIPQSRNILLQWTIPNDRVRDLSGINIHWTYDQNIPQNRWNVVRVPKEARRAVIEGLDTTKTIFFSIEAVTRSGNQLPTRYYRISPRGTSVSSSRGPQVPETIHFETNFPGRRSAGTTSTSHGSSSSSQHLARQQCLRGCTISMSGGRKTSTGCGGDEQCVEDCGSGRYGCMTGWCMSRSLLDSAKRHTN